VDESAEDLLAVSALPLEVEVNGNLARVVRKVSKYSSFLGSPYVFAEYRDAARYLHMTAEEEMYLLIRVEPGADPKSVARDLQKRLPELDVWTKREFSRQCERYWLSQTGAGGTILTSAFLGFLIGLAVVSQTIYAVTVEKIEEFATLRALGASKRFIAQVVLFQAAICGVAGCLIAQLIAWPLTSLARLYIPWVQASIFVVLIMALPSLGMCLLASFTAVQAALKAEPARVFRA
jgi:putative ABC transport system permease protein